MLRTMTVTDAEWVAALIRTAFGALECELAPTPSALRVTKADVVTHLATGGGAVHGHSGCVLWAEREGGLYLSRLAVLPEARGRGIGLALLARVEAAARDLGLPRVHLEVRLALVGNRALFRRAGFVEGVRHTHPGFEAPTFVGAEKALRLA